MMTRRLVLVGVLVAMGLFAMGCASPPRDEVKQRSDYHHKGMGGYHFER